MKFVNPILDCPLEIGENKINSIIIENQNVFLELCMDIFDQIQGNEGKTVVSKDDMILDISKNVELINQFIPFDINKKTLINKLISSVEKVANESDYYEQSMIEIANMEKFLWNITENMVGSIGFSKLSISNIIKSVGLEFEDDYSSLGEKLIDYMELVREYDKDKLFIFVNLRSYICDNEAFVFFETITRKQFKVLFIDNCEHLSYEYENRVIIDKDICVIK